MLNTLLAYLIKKVYYYYYNKYKHKFPNIDRRGKRALAFLFEEDLAADHVRDRPWMSSNRFGGHITWEFIQVARYHFWIVGCSMIIRKHWKILLPHLIYDIIGEIIYILEIILSYRLYWYNIFLVFVIYVGFLVYSFVKRHAGPKYQLVATASQYLIFYYFGSIRPVLSKARNIFGFGSFWHVINFFRKK